MTGTTDPTRGGPPVSATAAPDPVAYLDRVAATDPARRYKAALVDALDVRPGHTVVDVGCGPATDLGRLADAVGPSGTVIGVDHDPRMVEEARRRVADRANVEIRTGDARALPVPDGGADRVTVDRVMQHVADPDRVAGELFRVLPPGGVVALAEPDWDTLVIADEDRATSRAFARFLADVQVRNGAMGRELVGLLTGAGLDVRTVTGTVVLFRDFAPADQVLGLRRNAYRAVEAADLTGDAARAWLARLARGPFLAAFTLFTAVAVRPL